MSAEPAQRTAAAPNIAWHIVLLVLGAVLLANIATFAITFRGPPPTLAPTQLEDIARLLVTGRPIAGHGRQVQRACGTTALIAKWPDQPDTATTTALAQLLNLPVDRVIGAYGPPHIATRSLPREIFGGYTVSALIDGRWCSARTRPGPFITPWHRTTFAAMVVTLLLLVVPAWWIANAISRPLARLADAADASGPGGIAPPMPAGGPREVRRLAAAFDAMRDRLSNAYEARANMLAAIAHDLGTPLTRIGFWLDRLPETERVRAAADMAEMRAMIGSVLSFARDGISGSQVRLDLGSLLDVLVEDMAVVGRPVTLTESGPRLVVSGDPVALRRLFANLIENALRYAGAAEVAWDSADGWAEIVVRDTGPGIDPALLPRLFDPFVRGEPSRNRETGGSGLGLSIVRAIAEAHGGTATLANRAGGGAIATIRIPLAT